MGQSQKLVKGNSQMQFTSPNDRGSFTSVKCHSILFVTMFTSLRRV